jgi:hypothetical protein
MPWYKFEVSAAEVKAARDIQLITEFAILRQQHAVVIPGAHMFHGVRQGGGAVVFLSPDAEQFSQEFIKKHGGTPAGCPSTAEVKPNTSPFNEAENLLRAPVVNAQVVETFLKRVGVDVTPDTPSDECPWAYLASKKGSPRVIAVFASKHQPHVTTVQIWSILDSVQKTSLQAKDQEEKDAFYAGLQTTLSNLRASFGIVEQAALARGDILGRMLARMYVDISDDELTPRSLWEGMAATVESFELSEKFVNAHLGLGLRTTASTRIQ